MTNPKAAPATQPDVECRNCWQPKRTHSRMDGSGILYCHDGISSWNPPATAPAPDMEPTEVETLKLEVERLNCLLNTPETDDFYRGIELEAAHQRLRWPSEHDAGKSPADWFWLVGYLAGKCLQSAVLVDTNKALHHTISTAAALANWHRAIKGVGNMRPGIATPSEDAEDSNERP